jgi:hypothetical protein
MGMLNMADYDGEDSGSDEKEGPDETILDQAKKAFEFSQDSWKANQERYERDIKFGRKGEQWAPEDVEQRKQDGRPAMTINQMPKFIRQVVNDGRQNKPAIKVMPADSSADPHTAEVINGLIRNIENISKADIAYDTALDCAASGGFGFLRVGMKYTDDDTFDMDVTIDRIINPLTVYPDPQATSADGSDWNECFVTEMMPKDEFEASYPDADPISFSVDDANDRENLWYGEDEVRIAEYWVREEVEKDIHLLTNDEVVSAEVWEEQGEGFELQGIEIKDTRPTASYQVTQYIINGQEILETNKWLGKHIPIVPVYGEEVYDEGERHFYSLIHFAKDSQVMYNYWRTTTTELVAMVPKAPYIGAAGSFDTDGARWQNANVDTVAFLEYDLVQGAPPPTRQPFAGPPAGALQEAMNANEDMKSVMGIFDAGLGAQSNEISGVAISKRVREGDTSTYHFVDNLARSISHVGVIAVDLIPHVYSRARMVRVLGVDGAPETVAINQAITSPQMAMDGHYQEMQQQPQEQQEQQQERQEQQEAMNNVYDLTVGKYDVVVKSGPSYTTQREESRESMMALLTAFPAAAAITGDLVVEAMDWPNADSFAKRLKTLLPPGVLDESQDPMVGQLQGQLQEMDTVIQQLMAGKETAMADNAVKREKVDVDRKKADIDLMNAETNRMEAETDAAETASKIHLAENPPQAPMDETKLATEEMKLNHDQAKTEMSDDQETRRLDLERDRLEFEKEKFAFEAFKEQAGSGIVVDPVPEAPTAAAPPVQVFNVQSGNKEITLHKDKDGCLIGGTVTETMQ